MPAAPCPALQTEPIPPCRVRIILYSLLAGFAANVVGAWFAVYATLFPSDPRIGAALQAQAGWLFIVPFSAAAGLYIHYVLPLFRTSATLATYRVKVLGFPMFFALASTAGWGISFVQGIGIALVAAPQVPAHEVLLGNVGNLGIAFISMAIGYFLFEHLNRSYWIPTLFNNRLEAYKNILQPSISAKFRIYYLGTALAPMMVLGWIIVWVGINHPVFSRAQYLYMAAFVAFALMAGLRISSILAGVFQVPLVEAREATDRIARGDFDIGLTVHSSDELGMLGERINGMARSLQANADHIRQLGDEIEQTQREVVFTMGAIGETRSKETGNHVKRVAEYSRVLALAWGLDEHEAELLRQASPMHDIGKVAIPDSILNKPAKLTPEEFEVMKTHTTIGHEMLCHSQRDLLRAAAIVALQHHEKYDGSGYPAGLAGDRIHIYGRITAVADVFDALGSARVYKPAWRDEDIHALFRAQSGRHFDPRLIALFFDHLGEIQAIRAEFADAVEPVPANARPTPARNPARVAETVG